MGPLSLSTRVLNSRDPQLLKIPLMPSISDHRALDTHLEGGGRWLNRNQGLGSCEDEYVRSAEDIAF